MLQFNLKLQPILIPWLNMYSVNNSDYYDLDFEATIFKYGLKNIDEIVMSFVVGYWQIQEKMKG